MQAFTVFIFQGKPKPVLFLSHLSAPDFSSWIFPQLKYCRTVHFSIIEYLHIMNVAVKSTIERTKLRTHQDERLGYLSSLQESVQIINHPGRQ